MTKLCELFELRSVKQFRSPNRARWSGAAMADSVSLLRQSWFQGLVDVPAPQPLPPATTTNTIRVSETFYIHDSLPSLTGWSKWPYRAGTIFFSILSVKLLRFRKVQQPSPPLLQSHTTLSKQHQRCYQSLKWNSLFVCCLTSASPPTKCSLEQCIHHCIQSLVWCSRKSH